MSEIIMELSARRIYSLIEMALEEKDKKAQILTWALIAKGITSRHRPGDKALRSRIWEPYAKLWSSSKKKLQSLYLFLNGQ